jgi:hypothetical protein
VTEREALVAALRQRGVDWLTPSDATAGEAIEAERLIASLAAHPEARLRQALTGLFLLCPRDWEAVEQVAQGLDEPARDELMARYMAAVYLQRIWRTRLRRYLGEVLELPDLYSETMGLPPANEGFGKPGLAALADWHRARASVPYNRLAEYNQIADHVFAALRARASTSEPAFAR